MPVRISKNRVALENVPLNEAMGANIASASTINLTTATGNTVHITGTTAITAVTLGAGMVRDVIFDGILTLTHHATNNHLPGGVNITTAVNDRARYISDGTTVYCVNYQKADGTAVTQKIRQVVFGSYAVETENSTSTYADTGLSATITPLSTSSVLVLVFHGVAGKKTSDTACNIKLLRNAVDLGLKAQAGATNSTADNLVTASFSYLDSPASAVALTYKTQFASSANTALARVNHGSMVLMEIAA